MSANPRPVLPEVASIIVPPGFRSPFFSASSIMLVPILSLLDLPGLKLSSFA